MLFSFYLFFISIDMADLVEFDESRHRIVVMGMRAKDSAMGGHVGNYIIMIIIINKEVRKRDRLCGIKHCHHWETPKRSECGRERGNGLA
ncbi:hypothetical protein [Bifidobacterium moukalabense]|uniref:hypothetical protein n=2 Tax=Bifidobacterium moukalabense TaxID=1333651 RepID=UPI0005570CB9|nr:hypothetical protein [Bifidobacterium moukalabense]